MELGRDNIVMQEVDPSSASMDSAGTLKTPELGTGPAQPNATNMGHGNSQLKLLETELGNGNPSAKVSATTKNTETKPSSKEQVCSIVFFCFYFRVDFGCIIEFNLENWSGHSL